MALNVIKDEKLPKRRLPVHVMPAARLVRLAVPVSGGIRFVPVGIPAARLGHGLAVD